MSDTNQPTLTQYTEQNQPNITINIDRDLRTGKPKGLTFRSGRDLKIASSQQAKWKCEDMKPGGHVEIRLSPADTPFSGYRYESSVGSVISSGKAQGKKDREAAPYTYFVLVTTYDGVLLYIKGELMVTD